MSDIASGIYVCSEQDLFTNDCILQNIFGYLQPQQLPTCTLVNSQWYHLASEYLYKKVPLKKQHLLHQLVSICQNTQLGGFVRELRIDTSKLRYNIYGSQEFHQLMLTLCRSCINLQKLWFTYNSEEELNWMSILVHSATGLTHLNLDVVNKTNNRFRLLIGAWRKLETLEITHSTDDFIREYDDFVAFLETHSKLKQIVIMGDNHIPDILLKGLSEHCLHIRSLTLGNRHSFGSFSLSEEVLALLIKHAIELQTLNLGTTDSSMLLQNLDWLIDAGNYCKELKSLRWNVSFNPSLFPHSIQFRSLLISFTSLATLNLSGLPIHLVFAMLEGASHLSHTLSTLILKEVGEFEESGDQADYLSQIPLIFPSLRHLELHCYLNQILNRCMPNILQGLTKLEVVTISSVGAILEDEDNESSNYSRPFNPVIPTDSWFKNGLGAPLYLLNLRYLKLESIRVTNELIKALPQSCPNLTKLYMLSYFSRIYTPIDFSLICSLVSTLRQLNTIHLQWIALEEPQVNVNDFFKKAVQIRETEITYLTPLRCELGDCTKSSSATVEYEDEFISIKISIHK